MSWLSSLIDPQNQAAAAANQNTATLEQQQAAHDNAVKQDTKSVSDAFAQFNPDYYNNFEQQYENAYNPALTDQYNINKNQTAANLASGDQLDGSTGAYALGQLDKQYGTAQAGIANSAADAANTLKGTVNSTENNLYSLANQATDPLQMASQAQGAASTIVSPQSYPTVASTVGAAFGPVAAAAKSNNSAINQYSPLAQTPNAGPTNGNGSAVFS